MNTNFDDPVKNVFENVVKYSEELYKNEDFLKLKESKDQLDKKIAVLVNEIFESRGYPDKVKDLVAVKSIIEESLKKVTDDLALLTSNIIGMDLFKDIFIEDKQKPKKTEVKIDKDTGERTHTDLKN
jgi:hypothetical protein